MRSDPRRRRGFALLIVLTTLTILTLLYGVSTRLGVAHLQIRSAEAELASRAAEGPMFLRAAALQVATNPITRTVATSEGSGQIQIVDAGGMIDLNTAAPPLLDRYLDALGFRPDEIQRFRTWRQEGRRLLRRQDLIRVSGAEAADIATLALTATVVSGRTGVAADAAPDALTALLSPSAFDPYATPPSGVNFEVFLQNADRLTPLGAVHVRPDGSARFLRVD